MRLVVARETKTERAAALYDSAEEHVGGDSVTATRRGAPCELGVIFDEGTGDKTQVFFVDFLVDEFLDDGIRDGIFAVEGRAVDAGDFTFFDFHGEVGRPAVVAKPVAAT